ncbi:HNH endonuclease [Streptomyces chartreusis]
MTDLHLVNGCPSWCVEDHAGEPPEDWGHAGGAWEVRLPDGTLMMEARLVREPDAPLPRLAVNGAGLGALLDDVALLDADQALALEGALSAFTARVQRVQRTLRGQPSTTPAGKKHNPGQRARAGWRETRLYLAERDGRRCFYCHAEFDRLKGVTIDHYIPKSVWQCNLPANLVLACESCNLTKGDQLTWSMAAVLLAHAREGGNGREANRPKSGGQVAV